VWISICVLCLVLTITEIILLARHKLKPLTFIIMNVIKTGIWTALFVLDVISAIETSARGTSIGRVITSAILLYVYIFVCFRSSIFYSLLAA